MWKLSRNNRSEYLMIGKVTSTHGLKGEGKVYPTTDDPDRFKSLKEVLLVTASEELELTVETVKFFKQFVIIKFREFGDINQIEKFRGARLMVRRDEAVELARDEYFESDLIGMDVVNDSDGSLLGTLYDIIHTGANDVYDVRSGEGKSILIPAIKSCILEVDVPGGKMRVHLLEGLLDL